MIIEKDFKNKKYYFNILLNKKILKKNKIPKSYIKSDVCNDVITFNSCRIFVGCNFGAQVRTKGYFD